VRYTDGFEGRAYELIEASIATKQLMLKSSEVVSKVANVSKKLVDVFQRGNKALLFGNGGSAADAQHIAAELVGRFAFDRPALPALALVENASSITAIGNDHGFEYVFSRQVEALGRPGDAAIGISTTGNSPNVLRAISTAKKLGLYTVALTGRTGGDLKAIVDHCICVPSSDTPRVQECHILIGHIISGIVEKEILEKRRAYES
jgi:D-sedoheptulose 7-phosphate isomerase